MGNKICLPMHPRNFRCEKNRVNVLSSVRLSVRMLAECEMLHFRFGVQGIYNPLILIVGIYVN